jgi:hypothetical protein
VLIIPSSCPGDPLRGFSNDPHHVIVIREITLIQIKYDRDETTRAPQQFCAGKSISGDAANSTALLLDGHAGGTIRLRPAKGGTS